MRIALDGACFSPRQTGVGRYFQGLLRELLPLDPAIEYTLFLKEETDPGLDFPNLRFVPLLRPGSYALWQNLVLRPAVKRGGFDLFWSPNYSLPFRLGTPALLTVHDVSWLALPGEYPALNRLYRRVATGRGCRRARVVFADSEFTRREMIERMGLPGETIRCVHLGIEEGFRRCGADEVEAFKARHGLAGRRIVGFLGSFFRRRHVPDLIAAMEIVRRCHPDAALMLVGENHAVPPGRLAGDTPGLTWRERLAEDELNAFYSSLALFLYPSEYEGFGLPPMEALQCGTPSLLLRGSSLSELYHDLALFVDRADPVSLAEAIGGFFRDEAGAKARLLGRWQERRSYFSWRRAAGECLAAIREAP